MSKMPEWHAPSSTEEPLRLFNSLTRQKDVFVPMKGNQVTWYGCGPTVYDASHMGHARSYITFDIMRRVMRDYFKYDVLYVMNITDLDDKIIIKARQEHLLSNYKEKVAAGTVSHSQLLADINEAADAVKAKIADPALIAEKKDTQQRALDALEAGVSALQAVENAENAHFLAAVDAAADPLAAMLDKKFGKDVTDNSIFESVPRRWEAEFHKDMAALNVEGADVLKRVTEVVPEIVSFIQRIIDNGFAYESNGSVYFDVTAFKGNPDHNYLKLVPEAGANIDLLSEGEGALAQNTDEEKKTPFDFALWKTSKQGEPAWDSPWGKGRPGWHIECSVMASEVLGSSMDIHSGGVDLKFPHHDNELAQSEAYFGHDQWVNYFVHAGHLHIKGHKMSKSLKNFITIKEALAKYSARQIRFMFLLYNWQATLDYSDDSMETAKAYEKAFNEFFLNITSVLQNSEKHAFPKYDDADTAVLKAFLDAKAAIHTALCDSIDTPTVMKLSRDFITAFNKYVFEKEQKGLQPPAPILRQIGQYFTFLLRVFGAIPSSSADIGFPSNANGASMQSAILPKLLEFAKLRESVRKIALESKDRGVLELCDAIRDDILPNMGVRLEDKEHGPVVKLVDREILMQEREQELKLKEEKERRKREAAERKAKEEAEKREKAKVRPQDMFRNDPSYSKFDDNGVPTHDQDGEELAKAAKKKLLKQWKNQEKLHKKFFPEG